ncbi:MAG: hypothetical protein ABIH42_08675, partial [Planctomycetota bacterium]
WCTEMSKGTDTPPSDILEKHTAFVGKDGESVSGKKSVNVLSEKMILYHHDKIMEGTLRNAYKQFCEGEGVIFSDANSIDISILDDIIKELIIKSKILTVNSDGSGS